ncbi:hypothetical protein [Azotobacter chroococcum]|uniref:hypothetical protein n=1 Tax=Azotobacter chroococcum TaxID=353 RepID=UPI0010AEE86F|nr:hypothetical protein [Azotobacter chroococcum]TKD45602.1 hypothetical protein FCG41_03780 [Azotobacter chroococcum]
MLGKISIVLVGFHIGAIDEGHSKSGSSINAWKRVPASKDAGQVTGTRLDADFRRRRFREKGQYLVSRKLLSERLPTLIVATHGDEYVFRNVQANHRSYTIHDGLLVSDGG